MGETDLVCNEIMWRERLYKEGSIVVISRKDQLQITVGVIKSILVKGAEIYLLVRRSKMCQNFVKIFETEAVEDNLVFLNIKQLQDTYPLFMRGSESKYFVIPHHHVSFTYE